jgi:glycosyltransferase involved in cell wall biosynthesis
MNPRITVVMSVLNGERHLREAIDSILRQTLADFEFIVVDDGSTDATPAILASYTDRRVRVVTQENRGIAPSLNAAVALSRAPLIARMDADDLSEPARLERQVAFLDENPDYVVIGSDVCVIGEDGEVLYTSEVRIDDASIRRCLAEHVTPFYHGSVMFRRDPFDRCGGYDERIPNVLEDILLWVRLRDQGKLANLPEPLYRYRYASNSISRQARQLRATRDRVVREYSATRQLAPGDVQVLTSRSPTSARRARAAYELDLAKIYLDRRGDVVRARPHLLRAVALAPLSARAWFNLVLSLAPSRVRLWRAQGRMSTIERQS